jgi:hypothetical protein
MEFGLFSKVASHFSMISKESLVCSAFASDVARFSAAFSASTGFSRGVLPVCLSVDLVCSSTFAGSGWGIVSFSDLAGSCSFFEALPFLMLSSAFVASSALAEFSSCGFFLLICSSLDFISLTCSSFSFSVCASLGSSSIFFSN